MLASLRDVCSRCCLTAETLQGSVLQGMLGRADSEGELNFPRAANLSGDRLFCFLGRRCGWGSSVAEQPMHIADLLWPRPTVCRPSRLVPVPN